MPAPEAAGGPRLAFLPSGRHSDKVVPEHDSEITDLLRSGAMQLAEERLVASRARARAWLDRGRGGNTAKAWRKPKLNRVDSYKWTRMVNHWLLLHCNLDLEVFQQLKPMPERADPLTCHTCPWRATRAATTSVAGNSCRGAST